MENFLVRISGGKEEALSTALTVHVGNGWKKEALLPAPGVGGGVKEQALLAALRENG